MPDSMTTTDKGLPPGPKGLGLRRLLHRLRDGLGFYEQLHEQYGDIAYFRLFHKKFCVVYSPELIEEVLIAKRSSFEKGPMFKNNRITKNPTSISSDGDDHRRIRKLIQPAFLRKAMSGYAEVMIDEVLRLRSSWRDGETIDIDAQMHQLALNIIAKTFFGRDTKMDSSLIKGILQAMGWSLVLTMIPFGNLVARLPLNKNLQRHRAVEAIDQVVFSVIQKARTESEERTDLVSFLVHAKDEEGIDRALSDEEVRDESYIMILAGHETSANALTWCFYYLSRNPAVRVRLEKEVDEILGGRPPTLDDYNQLPYTRAVFDEALRLAPPIYVVGRTATEECVLGNYRISKGTVVQPCWRIPQRDEKYFPQADEFKPERWLGNKKPAHPRHAYVPFGSGLRTCIGASFAKMEVVFALSAITQWWRVDVVSDEFPEVVTRGIYKCKNGLRCTVNERKPSLDESVV